MAGRRKSSGEGGFTLIEVAVALAILAFVVLGFLGGRTEAIIDASEARNWRLAREIAQEKLSELQAGARELPPDGMRVPIEDYDGFSYQIVVGEAAISEHEAAEAGSWNVDDDRSDRLMWQRERDDLRRAQQKGLSLADYRDQQVQEDLGFDEEDQVPSEDNLEEVLVVVYFPDVRPKEDGTGEASFKLKARVSTLAIEGLTPEEADILASARGLESPGATGGQAPAEGQQQ